MLFHPSRPIEKQKHTLICICVICSAIILAFQVSLWSFRFLTWFMMSDIGYNFHFDILHNSKCYTGTNKALDFLFMVIATCLPFILQILIITLALKMTAFCWFFLFANTDRGYVIYIWQCAHLFLSERLNNTET